MTLKMAKTHSKRKRKSGIGGIEKRSGVAKVSIWRQRRARSVIWRKASSGIIGSIRKPSWRVAASRNINQRNLLSAAWRKRLAATKSGGVWRKISISMAQHSSISISDDVMYKYNVMTGHTTIVVYQAWRQQRSAGPKRRGALVISSRRGMA